MYDVIALGELLIDFATKSVDERGYPTFASNPGGAPPNFLAALAAFGCKTGLMGKVGNDSFGKMLINTLKDCGIGTEGMIVSDDVFTTLAFVTFDAKGDREFAFARKPGADMALTEDEVRYDLIDESRMFHFGTLSLTDEPARTATYRAVEYARSRGKIISCDPNLRLPLWKDPESAKEQMLWAIAHADVVKISDNEVEFLWGITPEEGAEKILREFGAQLVYVTCGSEGCVFANRNGKGSVPALAGVKPVDTTGAGDIFGGSAAAGLIKSGKLPGELTVSELEEIVRFACTAAGLSTEKFGGISSVPTLEEVRARL